MCPLLVIIGAIQVHSYAYYSPSSTNYGFARFHGRASSALRDNNNNNNNNPTISSIRSPDNGELFVAATAEDRSTSAAATAVEARRVPIGAAPDFSIDDDSAVVTPLQRWLVASHFAVTLASLGTSLASLHVASFQGYLSLAGVFILSVVAGDFGTGVFHWSVDNYGSLKTPVVGSVCAAFQGHHKAPWTITFRPFVNNVYKIALGTIPALLLTVAVVADHHQRMFLTLFINWWLVSQVRSTVICDGITVECDHCVLLLVLLHHVRRSSTSTRTRSECLLWFGSCRTDPSFCRGRSTACTTTLPSRATTAY